MHLDLSLRLPFNRHDIRGRLSKLQDDLAPYAPYLEVHTLNIRPVPSYIKKTIRNDFKKSARQEFLDHLLDAEPGALKQIGFDDYDFALIRSDERKACIIFREKLLQYDIDHLNPVFNGGDNDLDNLCLIPKKIHTLKNEFQGIQFEISDSTPQAIKVIMPKRNEAENFPKVLIISELLAA